MSSKKRETKVIVEISPEEMISRLQPIDIENYNDYVNYEVEFRQRRRELFSNYVPLCDCTGKRILKSYEIFKLANGQPIEKLEDPLNTTDFKLTNYHANKKKRRTDFNLEEDKAELEKDNEEEKSESDESSDSEAEEDDDSENEYTDNHSSDDEDLDD